MSALTITVWESFDDDGSPTGDGTFPAKWEICDRCSGNGHHGNPAFDGLSSSDDFWHEEDGFLDDYMNGKYDVPCEEGCDHGKVLVVDEEQVSPGKLEQLHEWYQEECDYRMQVAAERRMGA